MASPLRDFVPARSMKLRHPLPVRVVPLLVAAAEKMFGPLVKPPGVAHVVRPASVALVVPAEPVARLETFSFLRAHPATVNQPGVVTIVVALDKGPLPLRVVFATVTLVVT